MENNLEKHIQNNLDDLDRKKPDPIVLERILLQMQSNQKEKKGGVVISFRTMWWAAACVIAIACGVAVWQFQKPVKELPVAKKEETKPRETKPVVNDTVKHEGIDAVDEDLAIRKAALLDDIKSKKLIVFTDFNKIESAAGRINAVSATANLKNKDNDVVNALLQILDNDPNTNVRLAALDGLAGFYREEYTRKKLLASLKKQKDPIVQITLIGLLTRTRESGILDQLEKMVRDENTEKAVKDCAYAGILQLHG